MRGRGAVSLVVLLLSWLALDDITTDNANRFPLEYTTLVLAGIWFAALGVSMVAKRHSVVGISSLVAVGLGVMAFSSLPHHYQPASPINYLGFIPLAWFAGLTVWLNSARDGVRVYVEAFTQARHQRVGVFQPEVGHDICVVGGSGEPVG